MDVIEGKIFESIKDAKEYVNSFNKNNLTNFVIDSHNKKSLVYKCCHAVDRKSRSKGVRPKQHYNFVGCTAFIRMYKSKDGKVRVTKSDLEHINHVVDEYSYRYKNDQLNEEETELVMTLKEANTKTSQIRRLLCNKANKHMSTQRVKNLIGKLEKSTTIDKDLEDCLESIDSNGGTVKYTYDASGCVDALFISSGKMKQKFKEHNPLSIQMDTTFNIEEGKYKLVAFCYLDMQSNKTEIAAFALIANESESNFYFILQELKSLNDREDYIFLVDKDFTGINTIKRTFSEVVVLLCAFHVLKFMRRLIATALTDADTKKVVFEKFHKLTYCPSASLYEDCKNDFLISIKDLEVRSSQTYVKFTDYFEKNWVSCAEMWIKFYRNDLPLFGDHTTNRIERQFWTLKESLADRFGKKVKTADAIIHLINLIHDRLDERQIFNNNKRLVIFDQDKNIHDLNKMASQHLNERGCIFFNKALKLLSKRRNNLSYSEDGICEVFQNGESKLYVCTQISCTCIFNKENRAPCLHMLFRRDYEKQSLFDPETFDQRYRRNLNDHNVNHTTSGINDDNQDDIGVTDDFNFDHTVPVDDTTVSLNDSEKYKIIMPVLTNIASIISCHSTKTFLNYVDEFRSLESFVRRGKSVLPSLGSMSESLHNQENTTSSSSTITSPRPVIGSSSSLPSSNVTINEANPVELVNDLENNPNAIPSSKFKLKFKEALVSKGRRRNRVKQMKNFNRTNLDQKRPSKPLGRRKTADVLRDMVNCTASDDDDVFPSETTGTVHFDSQTLTLPQVNNPNANQHSISTFYSDLLNMENDFNMDDYRY